MGGEQLGEWISQSQVGSGPSCCESVFRCRCCPLLQRKVLSHLGILAQMAVVGGWLLGVSPRIERQYQF